MKTNQIAVTTARIIYTLYGDGRNMDKAALASLRGTTSLTSPRAQTIWPLLIENLDTASLSRGGRPTAAEIAIFTALRLYAIHQQGNEQLVYASARPRDEKGEKGLTIFAALAKLRQNSTTQVALDRRVRQLLTTTNIEGAINSLTRLAGIIKATDRNIQIDYASLAQDLYRFQRSFEDANRVRFHWGETYYHMTQETVQTEGKANS